MGAKTNINSTGQEGRACSHHTDPGVQGFKGVITTLTIEMSIDCIRMRGGGGEIQSISAMENHNNACKWQQGIMLAIYKPV